MLITDTDRVTAHLAWLEHVERWRNCQECPLCAQRDRIVLARGVVPADVCFVGEAPGVSEDVSGLPFDGPAGALLDQIVEAARAQCQVKGWTDAYTNLVACFPAEAKQTTNHQPSDDELEACRPRLVEFIEIVRPRLVVCVGALAKTWLPDVSTGPTEVVAITHPSYILSHMPAAQKDMAVRKCVVVIRDAVERVYGIWVL